jgi:anaerobic magnesium-protoporphyrin IX monomethyl ester cyclase
MKRTRIFLANLGLRTHMFPLVTPPMGLLSLAAWLRKCFAVDLMVVNQRLHNTPVSSLVKMAQSFEADIVGLSAMTTAAYLLEPVIREMRAAMPDVRIVVGGPHATAVGAEILKDTLADAVVQSEGELSFEMLVEAFRAGSGLDSIPALIWRGEDGEIRTNPGDLPRIENIDDLPMPAWDLIALPEYWHKQSIAPVVRRKYASIVSSRGCPYRCIWCHSIFGKTIRLHHPERIADEVEFHYRRYGVRDFEFLDDTFNFDRDRVIEFTRLLHQRNLPTKLAFPTGVRSDILTPEVIAAMHEAGMYYCGFALETGSPRLQKFVCKNLNIGRFLESVEETARRKVYTQGFCMMGFPTETEAELQQTVNTACNSRLHGVAFYTVTPFPGTPLYGIVQREHPEKLAGIHYDETDFSSMRVNLTDLPDDVLFAWQRKALRKFFSNPNRLMRIMRDYPQPHLLPAYIPILVGRATKGVFGKE